jgi:hypothetical protein
MRRLLRAATMPHRAYQRQKVMLTGERPFTSVGPGGFSAYSMVNLHAADQVVRAFVRVNSNSAAQPLGIEINGVDRTSPLGGSWTTIPIEIDITGYAATAVDNTGRIYARMRNNGGSTTDIGLQIFVEVLR